MPIDWAATGSLVLKLGPKALIPVVALSAGFYIAAPHLAILFGPDWRKFRAWDVVVLAVASALLLTQLGFRKAEKFGVWNSERIAKKKREKRLDNLTRSEVYALKDFLDNNARSLKFFADQSGAASLVIAGILTRDERQLENTGMFMFHIVADDVWDHMTEARFLEQLELD